MQWPSILIVLAALATPPAQPTMPGFLDAQKLAELCDASDADPSDGPAICLGYVLGSVDQLLAEQARLPLTARTICPPKNLTPSLAVQIVMQNAEWARSANDVGAAGFVRTSLEQAYPCSARTASAGR